MAFENIKDDSVRKLAETLRSSGLAASDTEAVRMAEEMSSTAKKVQRPYDEQEEKSETDSTQPEKIVERVASESTPESEVTPDPEPVVESKSESEPYQPVPEVPDPEKVDVKEVYKQQEEVINSSFDQGISPDKTVSELMAEDAGEIYSKSDDQVSEPEPEQSEPVVENEITISDPEDTTVSEQPVVPELTPEEKADGPELDESQEEKESEEDKKKEVESTPELSVDLSETFNFGKRKQ